VIFDRGRSSLRRCAHLENYLGFPRGIDVETFYDLAHDHAERTGCEIRPDLVRVVVRRGDGGFVIETDEGERTNARRVIAATRYDGEYMRLLDEDGEMFETYEHDGETHERFDRSYPERDGSTPVGGLYVASPSEEADTQAIMAAGRGARVAHRAIADTRTNEGWWRKVAEDVDWMRREATLDDEWTERETWIEWFDDYYGEDTPADPDSERFRRIRERYVDKQLSTYLSPDEIEARTDGSHETFAAHLDGEAVVSAVGERRLLEAIGDETIEAYIDGRRGPEREAR
jgi:hypothetical protein